MKTLAVIVLWVANLVIDVGLVVCGENWRIQRAISRRMVKEFWEAPIRRKF